MTNKEYIATLSAEEAYELLDWLFNVYARGYSYGRLAIIQWLDAEYEEQL